MKVLSTARNMTPSRPSVTSASLLPLDASLGLPLQIFSKLKDVLKDCLGEPSGAILFSRVGNIYIFFSKGKRSHSQAELVPK